MKKHVKKFIFNLLLILFLEFNYHYFVFKIFDIKSILFIVLFSILNTLFIDIITSIFKSDKINKWFNILINEIIVILFIAYFVNFKFYGNTLSIYSIFHGGQVFGFLGIIISVIKYNLIPILILFLPFVLMIIFNKIIDGISLNIKDIIIKLGVFCLLFIANLLFLNIDKKDIYSAKNLYFNKHVPNQTAQTFGILTTLRLDIYRVITNFEETVVSNNSKPVNKEEEIVKYNRLDIDFDSLINNENDEVIKNIHSYISSIEASNKNKYTGIFKDKNLIVFTAEAFSPIAVNEELTPTLYKLVNNGFVFNNFYTPLYYVSTSDGEYVTLTSLLPKESVWSFSQSSNNYLPYAYANVFNKLGYKSYAYHNGTHKYYNRHKSHPNMGYSTFMACGNGLEKISGMHCKNWPQSDLEMINSSFDMYSNEERFLAYYMTVSGHLEYNFMGNNMAYKNKDYVNNIPYSNAIKAYIASQIELDRALESLMNKLEEKGILEDTVIVLSADHYPYGLTVEEIKEMMLIEDEKFDIHRNNLIIYNSGLKKKIEVNKIGQSLDILPTVLNLFGIEFDSRLLMGTDLLSNNDGLVIFNDRSWITAYGKYNASTKVFIPFKEVNDGYVDEINNIVYNKYILSKNILEYDYYRKVFNVVE